jgi:hypothetical protein
MQCFRWAPHVAGGLCLLLLPFLVLASAGCERNQAGSGERDVADTSGQSSPVLSETFSSPEELARAVLERMEKEDVEGLKRLPLSKDEFRLYVWPKLPSAKPERNVPFEFVWSELHQQSNGSVDRNFHRYKGMKLELLDVQFQNGTTDYGTFKVHREARVRVRDTETGKEGLVDLFGSVMEWQGRYKLFSYVTD